MASAITGINRSITAILETAGPKTFFVYRYFQGGLDISDGSDEMSPWRRKPWLTVEEAELIRQLPAVRDVNVERVHQGPVGYEGVDLSERPDRRLRARTGPGERRRHPGRPQLHAIEYAAGARVAVINDKLAESLFPGVDPIGKRIKIYGAALRGRWACTPRRPRCSAAPTSPHGSRSPTPPSPRWPTTGKGWMEIAVVPTEAATVRGPGQVIAALRVRRGLRRGQDEQLRGGDPGPGAGGLQQRSPPASSW